jgi:hypothetical protein
VPTSAFLPYQERYSRYRYANTDRLSWLIFFCGFSRLQAKATRTLFLPSRYQDILQGTDSKTKTLSFCIVSQTASPTHPYRVDGLDLSLSRPCVVGVQLFLLKTFLLGRIQRTMPSIQIIHGETIRTMDYGSSPKVMVA